MIGDERHLAAGVRLGAQGATSGLANLFPERLLKLIESKQDDPRLVELVNEVLKFPVTPAVKALLAHRLNDPAWLNVRAPLVALTEKELVRLVDAYRRTIQEERRRNLAALCRANSQQNDPISIQKSAQPL